jgi:hypothetical protein
MVEASRANPGSVSGRGYDMPGQALDMAKKTSRANPATTATKRAKGARKKAAPAPASKPPAPQSVRPSKPPAPKSVRPSKPPAPKSVRPSKPPASRPPASPEIPPPPSVPVIAAPPGNGDARPGEGAAKEWADQARMRIMAVESSRRLTALAAEQKLEREARGSESAKRAFKLTQWLQEAGQTLARGTPSDEIEQRRHK